MPSLIYAQHALSLLQALKLAPLGMHLQQMRPYSKSPVASRAVEQLGADAMAAVAGVLLASDPSDWVLLQDLAGSYQVGWASVWVVVLRQWLLVCLAVLHCIH